MNCYNDWMNNRQDYETHNLDEAMQVAYCKKNHEVILINLIERYAWRLVDKEGKLAYWGKDDVHHEKVKKLPDKHCARTLDARYGFHIDKFKDRLAKVTWTLYPAGRYYTSDDGFDIQDNEQINICAIIDPEARILVPFMPMTDGEENMYRNALEERMKK